MSYQLSIVIPAYNEEAVIKKTVVELEEKLGQKLSPQLFEVLIIDDLSTDSTYTKVQELQSQYSNINLKKNHKEKGFGGAVRSGIECAQGQSLIIYTADGSDSPEDVFNFYEQLTKGNHDFVIGDRFSVPGHVKNYPAFKLLFNRAGNSLLSFFFSIPCKDITNSFKMYRLSFLKDLRPMKSPGFELTLELALKSLLASNNYKILNNSWKDREEGVSKMKVLKTSLKYLKTSYLIKTNQL